MLIQIPADLTIVTLRVAGRELPQRFTEAHARTLLQRASELPRGTGRAGPAPDPGLPH